jgi:O-antigen ligase
MPDAHVAVSAAPPDVSSSARLEQAGTLAIFGVAAALQFSIAIAQSLLAIAILCWLAAIVTRRERVEAPRFFWPLLAFGAFTLLSAAFSPQPLVSFVDTKQLVLLLVVPLTYRFIRGERATTMITVIVSAGAVSAAYGIFQYAILHYDIHNRARGTLGHYMTFSGLVMLVIGVALARILFGRRDRLWAALVMPALAVAVTVTFTRSATVGACVAAALLLSLKDFRLIALMPIVAAIFLSVAGPDITSRFASIFDVNNPTNRDRVAMLKEGGRMVRAHPLFGVGPNMVEPFYAQYRGPDAVEQTNPHLHNVPVQIAAEYGLLALAAWLSFVVVALIDLVREFRAGRDGVRTAAGDQANAVGAVPRDRSQTGGTSPRERSQPRFRPNQMVAAAALAAIAAMLAAGLFEYNFGDSEFLMLLLVLITLPFAAARSPVIDLQP